MATAVSRGSSFDTLPYEVKIRIFSRLPFCERVRLTRVSQSWRQFLLNWPEMFERIENRCDCAFERDLSYTMCQLNHALLPYAPYIQPKAFRDLSLLMLSDNTANQKNMILENTFDFFIALRFYYIEKCFISITCLDEEWFSKFIKVCSHNLKRLEFMMRPDTPIDVPFLDLFLLRLTHLEDFRLLAFPASGDDGHLFAGLFLNHFDGVSDSIPENWSVKTIELDCHGSAIYMPLDTFVTKLRGLQFARIKPADFRDPLTVGQAFAQCPNLRLLIVDKDSAHNWSQHKKEGAKGLYHLELTDQFCKPAIYLPLLTKHHQTLETLKLDGLVLTRGTMRALAPLEFPALKKIVIKDKTLFEQGDEDEDHGVFASGDDFDTFIHRLPPQLEYLHLSVYSYLTDGMLRALESVACLKKLELVVCNGITEEGLLHFLNHTQSKDTLEELILTGQHCVTNDVLHTIGRNLSALTYLSLTSRNNVSLFDGLDRFLDTSPIIGKLHYLAIDCNKDDDFVPTNEQVEDVLHKLQAKVSIWHFCLDAPSKKRRRLRGVDFWFKHYAPRTKESGQESSEESSDEYSHEYSQEDSEDDDNESNGSEH